jgi:hypothetical protein
MDTPRKVIVGYDLCEDFTQISCYSYKSQQPIPICPHEEEEYCLIPTALCLKTDTKQWLYGEEAVACASDGAGILVDHLLERVYYGDELELSGQKYSGITLLEKFFNKTLTLAKNYFPTEPITKLVVTIRSTEPVLVDRIYEKLASLGIKKDRAVVMNHAGAYLYYALSQDRSLWMNDVGLFDFTKEGLHYYQIVINRRTKPIVAALTKKDCSETFNMNILKKQEANPEYIFENLANTILFKQIISTLYFTGSGFEGSWAGKVMKDLCVGRRVYYGQNLFTKGACYAAKELSGDKALSDFLLLDDDMVSYYISVKIYCDSVFKEIPLTEAGENWYEVDKSIEVIQDGAAELEVILKNIMTRDIVRERVPLTGLPDRPDRMTRLQINFTCKDKSTGIIRITDLGFGEFYPGMGLIMEHTIEIG